jgi:hypothetical protein
MKKSYLGFTEFARTKRRSDSSRTLSGQRHYESQYPLRMRLKTIRLLRLEKGFSERRRAVIRLLYVRVFLRNRGMLLGENLFLHHGLFSDIASSGFTRKLSSLTPFNLT